jgi:hypothetical protein
VTQRFLLSGTHPRQMVLEANCAAPVADGAGQPSLFGRGEPGEGEGETPRLMLGSQIQLAF